eukprot:gene12259-14369_t
MVPDITHTPLSAATTPTTSSLSQNYTTSTAVVPNTDTPWFCNVDFNSPRSGGVPLPLVFSSFSTPLFRNFYHNIEFYVPDQAMQSKYQNQRIYISDSVGYSGNAKKFINSPQPNEVALYLEAQVLDTDFNPLPQCTFCREYFQSRFYFANNPQCKEKLSGHPSVVARLPD